MGQGQSTPEKIHKLARAGKDAELKILLLDLQRNDRYYTTNRASYLESQDELGNTPLTAAAARGSYACVQLLIEQGSNIHHQNRRAEGGSALHEAVARRHDRLVDLLLRCGANPFTENVKGFTAMDIACASRNTALVRRLEAVAPFRGWLLMKVPKFAGLGSCWERRWCIICHRFPYPLAPPAQQLTHVVFLAYKNETSTAPACRAWLDGAHAREFYHPQAVGRISCPGPAQAAVILHRKHDVPAGAYVTAKPPSSTDGYTFYLRPDDGSQPSVSALQRFMDLVNNRGFAPAPLSPQAGTGHHPAVGQMATTPGEWAVAGPLQQGYEAAVATTGYQATVGGAGDEDYARRLQEQYDQEAAAHYQNSQADITMTSSPRPSYTTSASVTPHAEGSGDLTATGDGRYPRPFSSGSSSLPMSPQAGAALHSAAGEGGTGTGGPLAAASSAPPALSSAMAAEAATYGRQQRPVEEAPSAPPLISLDSPARPSTLPAPAAAEQHVSSPTPNWWQDLPPAPTARPVIPASAPAVVRPSPSHPQPDVDEDKLCVVCLSEEATAGVLHNESVHACLCHSCAQDFKAQNVRTCPMCREPVDAYIMRVF